MEPKFKIGDEVRHYSDCVTIFKIKDVQERNINYFYDITNGDFSLEKVPEHELSSVDKNKECLS